MRSFNKTAHNPSAKNAEVSCMGKVGLDSYERAAQVLKRHSPKAPAGRSAYHCSHCQKWHIGTDNGGIEKKRASQFKERKYHG